MHFVSNYCKQLIKALFSMPHYTHNHGTWSNQSYQPGSYCFFIVLLELKIFKNKQHNKKTIWPSISYFWAFSFICMQTSGEKNQFKYNSKIFFSFPINVQSKNTLKKTQFRTNEQLEYIAALPRTNKSITFYQQMLVFLANEEKRIKSNFKLKRYEIKKKKLIIFWVN